MISINNQPKEGKMKRLILLSVLAFVFWFTFGLFPTNAKAEDVEYPSYFYGINSALAILQLL
jgi:hypothetical protein